MTTTFIISYAILLVCFVLVSFWLWKSHKMIKEVQDKLKDAKTATEEIQHRHSELILAGTTVMQMCDEKDLQKRFSPEELEQRNKMLENLLKPDAVKISDEDK